MDFSEEVKGKKIFTWEDAEKMGNSIMPHHKRNLFIINTVRVDKIRHSHEPRPDSLKWTIAQVKEGNKLPPIPIDKDMTIMDGNHRLYAHEERGIKKMKALVSIGELYPLEVCKECGSKQ